MKTLKLLTTALALVSLVGGQLTAQTITVDNANIVVQAATNVTVQGGLTLTNNATIDNSGDINLSGDWTNNAGTTGLVGSSPGSVNLDGGSQSIAGTSTTRFYNLNLLGSGLKSLLVNTEVEGALDLGERQLAAASYEMYVSNPATAAISRDSGYVSSGVSGGLVRATNSSAPYLFPVGSGSAYLYRPAQLNPATAGSNLYKVNFVGNDPGTDGYDRTMVDTPICSVNGGFYHQAYRTAGSDDASLELFYDNPGDGDYDGIAQWTGSQWENTGSATTTSMVSPALSSVNSASIDFSSNQFGLSKNNPCPIPPVNDLCANAINISYSPAQFSTYGFAAYDVTCRTVLGTNVDATLEAMEPVASCGGSLDHTVWYRFVAPSCDNFTVTASTDNSSTDYNTSMAIYHSPAGDCNFASFTEVSCSDDATGGCEGGAIAGASTNDISASLTAGEVYYIQVDGPAAATGVFELSIAVQPPAPTLTAGSTPATMITASWMNHSADNYDLYFRPEGSSGYGVRWNDPDFTQTFTYLNPNTNYEFWMRNECLPAGAEWWYGQKDTLRTAEATCASPNPLICGTTTANSIQFAWSSDPDATLGYTIYIQKVGSSGYSLRYLAPGVNTYTWNSLDPLSTYRIWVVAKCLAGLSSRSTNLICSTSGPGAAVRYASEEAAPNLVNVSYEDYQFVDYPSDLLLFDLADKYLGEDEYYVDFSTGEVLVFDSKGNRVDTDQQAANRPMEAKLSALVIPNVTIQSTEIQVSLPAPAETNLAVYDIQGQVVYQLSMGKQDTYFTQNIDCSNWATGMYQVVITAGNETIGKKLVVMD